LEQLLTPYFKKDIRLPCRCEIEEIKIR
jgi:hypothetical protein